MSSPQKVTLADVARHAGVSSATASYALRGDGRVKILTRKKVAQAAQTLGYQPDVHASALASSRFRPPSGSGPVPIHLVVGDRVTKAPNWFEQMRSIAAVLGYGLHFERLGSQVPAQEIFRHLYNIGSQGILLHKVHERTDLEQVDWSRFSVVNIGSLALPLPVLRVRPGFFSSAFTLWNICWDHGYRRIGGAPMSHNPRIPDDVSRAGGILSAQMLKLPPELHIPPFTGDLEDQEGFTQWLRRYEPDCVIGFSSRNRWWLSDANYRAGYAALHISEFTESQVAGMFERFQDAAQVALHTLDQQIRFRTQGFPEIEQEVVIPQHFQPGPTLLNSEQ